MSATDAAPAPPAPFARWVVTEPKALRFYVLLRWLHESVGPCGLCAIAFAIRIVELEAGEVWDPGSECTKRDRRGRTCYQLLEERWKERPAAPKVEVAGG